MKKETTKNNVTMETITADYVKATTNATTTLLNSVVTLDSAKASNTHYRLLCKDRKTNKLYVDSVSINALQGFQKGDKNRYMRITKVQDNLLYYRCGATDINGEMVEWQGGTDKQPLDMYIYIIDAIDKGYIYTHNTGARIHFVGLVKCTEWDRYITSISLAKSKQTTAKNKLKASENANKKATTTKKPTAKKEATKTEKGGKKN